MEVSDIFRKKKQTFSIVEWYTGAQSFAKLSDDFFQSS